MRHIFYGYSISAAFTPLTLFSYSLTPLFTDLLKKRLFLSFIKRNYPSSLINFLWSLVNCINYFHNLTNEKNRGALCPVTTYGVKSWALRKTNTLFLIHIFLFADVKYDNSDVKKAIKQNRAIFKKP